MECPGCLCFESLPTLGYCKYMYMYILKLHRHCGDKQCKNNYRTSVTHL